MVATTSNEPEVFPGNAAQVPVLRRHVLDLDDFTAEEITATLDNAAAMRAVLERDVKKVPALRGRVIVTLFYEASTRTRISFEEAGKILSADVINMTASASSIEKGESLLNTGLTLQAMGVDVIVVRHPHSGAPHFLARNLNNVAVINAGDGAHAHPTQGLLDLYTARDHLGELAGRKVVIVGDVLHSRVARSAVWGFAKAGSHVVLSGPPTLMPDPVAPGGWGSAGNNGVENPLANVTVDTNLDTAIEGADLVMALRLQSERQQRGFFPSLREYIRRWQVNDARMAHANPDALLMHPGPMNEGIEVSSSQAHGDRSLIEEQVTNGVAIRMALLYQLAGAAVAEN
ncbi:MAG: aspartate carbamoyltransferase catalytic subunit [Chloroflexi bacterium]|nr:aspartate carbamoyltransferase catalytic subunit [Chloroflexota bacterium]